jgi:hypothetical protein
MRNESGDAENLTQSRHFLKTYFMLNNKKSLLQRARIAMVAIVTIVGISGAFAMTPHHNGTLQTWGVLQTNATTYVVTALGPNEHCVDDPDRVCTVKSSATPNPTTHEIPISTASDPIPGDFSNASTK